MEVRIFGKKECSLCKATSEKISFFVEKWKLKSDVAVVFYDMDTIDGLAEGSFQNAMDVPTTVFVKDGLEIARVTKEVPDSGKLEELLLKNTGGLKL